MRGERKGDRYLLIHRYGIDAMAVIQTEYKSTLQVQLSLTSTTNQQIH